MEHEILVFRGEFDTYVTCQPYSGRIPPEVNSVIFDGEKYVLTAYEYQGNKYLIAHQEKIKTDSLEDAIRGYNPKPLN